MVVSFSGDRVLGLLGFSGIDALEDAESSKVPELQLEFFDGLGPGDELGGLTLLSFLEVGFGYLLLGHAARIINKRLIN